MVAGILAGTLWPFDFFATNKVSWLPNANGVRFRQAGVIVSEAPLIASATEISKSWSLELLLRPENVDSGHTILSFHVPNNPRPLKIRQWANGLLVSHNPAGPPLTKARTKFDVDHAFQEENLALLTMTSGPNGTVVYLNGNQKQSFPKFTISQDDLAGQIVLGISPSDDDPWSGEIRGLAIYSKEFSPAEVLRHFENWTGGGQSGAPDLNDAIALYSFNERTGNVIHSSITSAPALQIPKRFSVPHKTFLKSPTKDFEASWDYVDDVLRNIAGFVPMGFLLCAFWNRTRTPLRAFLYTILAGGLLSFTIEVLQFFIPQRNSGITDIITNTIGATIGALLAISEIGQMIFGTKDSPGK